MRASQASAPRIVDLFDREIGEGIFAPEDVLDSSIALAAFDQGALVGAAIAEICTGRTVVDIFPDNQRWIAELLPFKPREKVGELQMLAVEPGARSRGIGRALLKARIDRLEAQGVKRLIAFAWTSEQGGCHAGPLLEEAGLRPLVTVERFYEAETLENGVGCPVCGHDGCRCAAVIYIR